MPVKGFTELVNTCWSYESW